MEGKFLHYFNDKWSGLGPVTRNNTFISVHVGVFLHKILEPRALSTFLFCFLAIVTPCSLIQDVCVLSSWPAPSLPVLLGY